MGVFLQAVASSQSPAEKRNVELHTGQSTLPGLDISVLLFSERINAHAGVAFCYSCVLLLSPLATNGGTGSRFDTSRGGQETG